MQNVLIIVTPNNTNKSLSFDFSSLGKTEAIAIAAEAPQIATAPPIKIPNLVLKPNIFNGKG